MNIFKKLFNRKNKYYEIENVEDLGIEFQKLDSEIIEIIREYCLHLPQIDLNKINSIIDININDFQSIDSIDELIEEIKYYLKEQYSESSAIFKDSDTGFSFLIDKSKLIVKDGFVISHRNYSRSGKHGDLLNNYIVVLNARTGYLLEVFNIDLGDYERLTKGDMSQNRS